jgi:alpha-mannosidase
MNAALLPFPQLLFQRLRKALNRLAANTWHDPVPLEVWRTGPRAGSFSFREAKGAPLRPVVPPVAWRAPGFSTSWFRVRLPSGYQPGPTDHLHWDDNAEATAWLEGEPIFGLDATHRQWPWPKGARELWLESIFCQSGIWHAAAKGIGPLGSVLAQARLIRKHEESWQAYFDLEVLTDWLEEELRRALPQDAESLVGGYRTWPEMDRSSATFLPDGVGTGVPNRQRPELVRLPALLRRVFHLLDQALLTFHQEGTPALRRALQPIYLLLREGAFRSRVTLTGHAHIDLVWLWPERTGEQKAVRTFATVNRLLSSYPEFHFGYTQPASYEAVARRAPGLMRRVVRQIRGGRWEPNGAMYVESDTLIPCGEALLRSLLVGQRAFTRLQGSSSSVLWLPDAFGFSSCLPTLMRVAQVRYFYTGKLAWNMINRFPHSSFVWRGADGSEVLAHVSHATAYNNPARPRNLRLEAEAHRQADVHPELLLPSGWGDGGGGPTADIIERVRRQGNLRDQPGATWGRIDGFYRRLERIADKLPVWSGEIQLEAHRGTYTTHGWVKEAYRRLERALQMWEAARCARNGGPIPDHCWKRLVFAQFHDCLPGSSTDEVYEETVPELRRLTRLALREAKRSLGSPGRAARSLFNPLPLPMPVWRSGRCVILPPLGWAPPPALRSDRQLKVRAPLLRGGLLSNSLIQAEFDRRGNLQALGPGGGPGLSAMARFVVYRDIPYDFEAWEVDRAAFDLGVPLRVESGGTLAAGPGWKGVRQRLSTPRGSTAAVLWRVRAGFAALELVLDINWVEPESLLRLEVPTVFRGQTALFGAPYGADWRLQQPGDPRQSAQWEVSASRWALASDDGREGGVFVLAEAKYGFSIRDGVLGVSILRAARITATNAFPPAFRAGPKRPEFSDLGAHRVRLGVGRLTAEAPREAYPAALAETLFAEPLAVAPSTRPPMEICPVIEGMPSLTPVWAAPIGAGRWTLRLNETMGRRGLVRLIPPAGWGMKVLERAEPGPADKPLPTTGVLTVKPFDLISLELFRVPR